eukprot:TRINITY_DN32158_c0_g1_i5.p1 TRINITY_DN32158_c0_g1~~TRINITY_DN32158_c0_g1_i5.p1  ORF type:complete len:773 (-),score=109.80 TRINITY_DN32158_c0_g1_i5:412-2730(-)
MEFGTPSTRLSRRRNRGSRKSEDLAPSTPSNRSNPVTPGCGTPSNSRVKVEKFHANSSQTPGSHRLSACGDIDGYQSGAGPQYSGMVEQGMTPSRSYHHHLASQGGVGASPSTALHTPSRTMTSQYAVGTPRVGTPITPSNAASASKEANRSPIQGRILKVFKDLPFANNFTLEDKIGEGTFSTVYLANRKDKDIKIALKHLVPTSKPGRIMMEAGCMRAAGGHPNIIQLLGMWRVEGDIVLVMPYLKHARFSDLIFSMDISEVKSYIGNLLSALRHIHKLGIIHRDIKPSNFLYDREKKKYALVDFGLAQYQADLKPGGTVESGRGRKRKPSDDLGAEAGASGRLKMDEDRQVLDDIQNKLAGGSPTIRALRENRTVRRSPRKTQTPLAGEIGDGKQTGETSKLATDRLVDLVSPVKREGVGYQGAASPILTPRKRLRLSTGLQNSSNLAITPDPGTTTTVNTSANSSGLRLRVSPRKRITPDLVSPTSTAPGGPAIRRQSPRKQCSLTRPSGFSKLTITGSTIVGTSGTCTPSLSRTPSFTMLEPASYIASQTSQATEGVGRTPMLRASVTSTCSSVPLPVHRPRTEQPSKGQCRCMGVPRVCTECLAQPHMHAPRAGTPGFRPPEVLLKHPNQTTAIDLWAVGVILISILSRSYPFFRAPDDMTALAELTVIFGSQQMKTLAKKFGRRLTISKESDPQDLEVLCRLLAVRERKDSTPSKAAGGQGDGDPHNVTTAGIQLVSQLLVIDHSYRITADGALNHPFLKDAVIV